MGHTLWFYSYIFLKSTKEDKTTLAVVKSQDGYDRGDSDEKEM